MLLFLNLSIYLLIFVNYFLFYEKTTFACTGIRFIKCINLPDFVPSRPQNSLNFS